MNFFSTPAYLSALGDAYFPRAKHQPALVSLSGRTFQVLKVGRSHVSWVPFMDFLEPLRAPSPKGKTRAVPFLEAVALRKVTAETYKKAGHRPGEQPSPLIDWTRFKTWDDYVAYAKKQDPAGFRSSLQKQKKKLEETHGAITFALHDPSALDQVCAWKSQQYRASGFPDGFKSKKLMKHFHLLRDRDLLTVSTLRANGKLIAGHVGIVHEGRFYYWLPAYDGDFASFSVGVILLEEMLKEGYARQHAEFDFLLGEERYKWGYATDVRIVGSLGTPPLAGRVYKRLRRKVIGEIKKHDTAYKQLQELKRRFLEWKIAR